MKELLIRKKKPVSFLLVLMIAVIILLSACASKGILSNWEQRGHQCKGKSSEPCEAEQRSCND